MALAGIGAERHCARASDVWDEEGRAVAAHMGRMSRRMRQNAENVNRMLNGPESTQECSGEHTITSAL